MGGGLLLSPAAGHACTTGLPRPAAVTRSETVLKPLGGHLGSRGVLHRRLPRSPGPAAGMRSSGTASIASAVRWRAWPRASASCVPCGAAAHDRTGDRAGTPAPAVASRPGPVPVATEPGARTPAAGPPPPPRQEIAMNRIRRIRRLAAAAAALAGALLAFAAAAPAALAWPDPPLPRGWQHTHPLLPPGHWTGPVYTLPARTVVAAGMPGWQIALVAAAAALAAATDAMLPWTGPGPGVPGPRRQRPVRAARRGEVPIPDQINRRAA